MDAATCGGPASDTSPGASAHAGRDTDRAVVLQKRARKRLIKQQRAQQRRLEKLRYAAYEGSPMRGLL